MRDGVVLLGGKETGDQFCAFAKRAGSIDIISPFITTPGVEKRLTALKGRKKIDVKILTPVPSRPIDQLTRGLAHALPSASCLLPAAH
jgi:hypothetical protein